MTSGSRWHTAGSTGGRSGRLTSGSCWREAGSTGGSSVRSGGFCMAPVRVCRQLWWDVVGTAEWRSRAHVLFHRAPDALNAAALVEHRWHALESCAAKTRCADVRCGSAALVTYGLKGCRLALVNRWTRSQRCGNSKGVSGFEFGSITSFLCFCFTVFPERPWYLGYGGCCALDSVCQAVSGPRQPADEVQDAR